jgi:succinate dehydrogenase/fumarate reductase cytochrome b subunit
MFFVPNVIAKADPATGMIISGLWIIVSVLANWYALAFGITLYKQAKAVTDEVKPAGMGWIKVVAIIGWVLAIIAMVVGFSVAGNMIRNAPKYQRQAPGSVYRQDMFRGAETMPPAAETAEFNSL